MLLNNGKCSDCECEINQNDLNVYFTENDEQLCSDCWTKLYGDLINN